jgi:hypothetical protein
VVVQAEMVALALVIQEIVADQEAVVVVTKRQQVVRQLMVKDLQAALGRILVQSVVAAAVELGVLDNQAV